MWRHMTSICQILIKLSEYVKPNNILTLSKYQVNLTIFCKVIAICMSSPYLAYFWVFLPISHDDDVITKQWNQEISKKMFLTCVNINFRKSDHFPTAHMRFSEFGEQKTDRGAHSAPPVSFLFTKFGKTHMCSWKMVTFPKIYIYTS